MAKSLQGLTKAADWFLQFLKNKTKTFSVLYNIFSLLQKHCRGDCFPAKYLFSL